MSYTTRVMFPGRSNIVITNLQWRPCEQHGGNEHYDDTWHWSECEGCLNESHRQIHSSVTHFVQSIIEVAHPQHCFKTEGEWHDEDGKRESALVFGAQDSERDCK